MDTNLFLTTAYSLAGGMMLAGFVPQIWSLVIATGRSKAISISTYFIWAISTFISAFYALMVAQDVLIAVIGFGAAFGNTAIIILTVYNRFWRFQGKEISCG
ncbi:MAG: hypothetical protein OXR68_03825 [Alphaproteobacteria bacterium]|nr:hypothetical protein [Alphaproteobacteria bacterium]MDD9919734.1 hypothetical protein [Alphaproteobacteria bacterium]